MSNWFTRLWGGKGAALASPAEMLALPSKSALEEPIESTEATGDTPPEYRLVISPARQVTRFYPIDQLDPEKLRDYQRLADLGTTFLLQEIYDDVATDAHVESQIARMKLGIAGAPWEVEPGEDSDLGREIAEKAEKFLQAIPDFAQLQIDLLDAEFRGFATVQPKWVAERGAWWVKDWWPIEARFYRFIDGVTPVVETLASPSGEPLPEGVLYHVARDRPGVVSRCGFGRSILKPWLYKGYCLIDGMSFIERFGHPHVQVELPPSIKEGSPELERAKSAARSLIADQIGLVPPGVSIKILESVSKAATVRDVYLAFVEFCDAAISKAILGQTGTTETGRGQGGLGTGGAAQVQENVEQRLRELRARRLDEFLTRTLLKWWAVYHYGPDAPAPRLCHRVGAPTDEQAKANTQLTRAKTLVVLVGAGAKVKQDQVAEEFDLDEAADGDELLVAPAGPKAGNAELHDTGACPSCGSHFLLGDAQKKKRSLAWGT